MKILFKESFAKDLAKITDGEVIKRVRRIIESVENAHNLSEIPHIKKLHATTSCFRIRVGQYRLGFIVEKESITFVRILHRREVYRYFP